MLLDDRLSLTGALFRPEKDNARVPDPTNAVLQHAGRRSQRVDGLELGALGHITDDWQITAGYAYLDSSGDQVGRRRGAGGLAADEHAEAPLSSWTDL